MLTLRKHAENQDESLRKYRSNIQILEDRVLDHENLLKQKEVEVAKLRMLKDESENRHVDAEIFKEREITSLRESLANKDQLCEDLRKKFE